MTTVAPVRLDQLLLSVIHDRVPRGAEVSASSSKGSCENVRMVLLPRSAPRADLLGVAETVLERPEQGQRGHGQRRDGGDEHGADDPTAKTECASAGSPREH